MRARRDRRAPTQSWPWAELLVVGAAAGFVFWQLRPDLLLADTTTTGGDLGAHVWGPAYVRDHLLPQGRLTGWAPDWFAGFPWPTFYFPVPNLLVVALDLVLPYNVAFKLVAVSGLVALPAAAWLFGRLIGLPAPAPPCLAVATVPFLFDRSYSIYGGNIRSMLAGEYAYSIGLCFALVFLGVYAAGLRTGRHRALAAALLALTAVTHVVTAFFALLGMAVFTLVWFDRRRVRFALVVGGVAALVAAFWVVPFLARVGYTTDLGWEKLTTYRASLFPGHLAWAFVLGALGVVPAAVARRRSSLAVVALAAASAAFFVVAPQSRLWNGRLLPFWYLSVALLAAVAVAELAPLVARARARPGAERALAVAVPVGALVVALVYVALPMRVLPSWFPVRTEARSYIPEWVHDNFRGYERTAGADEYRGVVETMQAVGRTEGCGRALWEYGEELVRFGTAHGLELLPYWTDGCIASMKGLFDESSATSPFLLLTESELSLDPSQHKADLPYRVLDVPKGVEHLRLLGVRYYLAFTEEARAEARRQSGLRLIATSGPWTATDGTYAWPVLWEVYLVEGSDMVTPLAYEPVVLDGVPPGGGGWLDAAVSWFQDSSRLDVPLATGGPASWARVRRADDELPRRPVAPAGVSDIRSDDDSISFEVDRPGVPVLVKASYFPNWKVTGARGVWRVTPNHMVVVPTDRRVTLRYGLTPVDMSAWLLTALGLVAVGALWWRDRTGGTAPPRPPRVAEDAA